MPANSRWDLIRRLRVNVFIYFDYLNDRVRFSDHAAAYGRLTGE